MPKSPRIAVLVSFNRLVGRKESLSPTCQRLRNGKVSVALDLSYSERVGVKDTECKRLGL